MAPRTALSNVATRPSCVNGPCVWFARRSPRVASREWRAQTGAELRQLMASAPAKLLGLFHTGNMNVYLDRQHRKDPQILGRFPDQPSLMEMTEAALNALQQNQKDSS